MKKAVLIFATLILNGIYCIGQFRTDTVIIKNPDSSIGKSFLNGESKFDDNGRPFTGADTSKSEMYGKNFLVIKEFVNGEKIKATGYYENGMIYRVAHFKNSRQHGIDKIWSENGNLLWLANYENDKLIGPTFSYYESGEIESINYPKYYNEYRATGLVIRFHTNGQIATIINCLEYEKPYKCDEIAWWENGALGVKTVTGAGKTTVTHYWSNGKKAAEYTNIDNVFYKVGKATEWYEDGQKKSEVFYKDGNKREEANFKIGTWSYWDEKGNLIRQEKYKDNVLVDTKEFLPKIKKE